MQEYLTGRFRVRRPGQRDLLEALDRSGGDGRGPILAVAAAGVAALCLAGGAAQAAQAAVVPVVWTQEADASQTDAAASLEEAGPDGAQLTFVSSEAAKLGIKTDSELIELVRQGSELSKLNVKQLETGLKSLPYHFPTRARLLGFYSHKGVTVFGRTKTIEARRRHILWLIRNHPESAVAGLPEAIIDLTGDELADPEGYAQAKALWLDQAVRKRGNPAVRLNAAYFLILYDKAIAESLL